MLGITYHTLQAYLRHPIDEPPAAASWTVGANPDPGDVIEADSVACADTVEV